MQPRAIRAPRFSLLFNFASLAAVSLLLGLHAAVPAQGPEWPQDHSDIPASPRVTWGRLDNGLRFAVMPNRLPAETVSLRLLVMVGALQEHESERGYAHFIEHLGFRSTAHFTGDGKMRLLEEAGAQFGPHLNAQTSLVSTLYKLDLPDTRPATFANGLQILRDFADGLQAVPLEVEKERGVILSEAMSRRSSDQDRRDARRAYLLEGSLAGHREPIGTEAAVKAATPSSLRSFYDGWYRPERMIVIIVGDVSAPDVVAAVTKQFASVQGRGPARESPPLGRPTADRLTAQFYPEKRNGVEVELATINTTASPADTEQSRRDVMAMQVAWSMLQSRFNRRTEPPDNAIRSAGSTDELITPDLHLYSVMTAGATTQWQRVLATGEQELRRALEYGFLPAELALAKRNFRPSLQLDAERTATTSSSVIANLLAYRLQRDEVVSFPDERLECALQNLDQLTLDDCQQALARAWGTSPRAIFVTASPTLLKLKSAEVIQAYEASRASPLALPSTVDTAEFAYVDFGPRGLIASREHIEDLDVWLVRFANGVRLNLKRTEFDRGMVRYDLRFGNGRLEEPPTRPGLFAWAGPATVLGGLGRYSGPELQRVLSGSQLTVNLTAAADRFHFTAGAPASRAPLVLRLMAATLTDAAYRPDANERLDAYKNDFYLAQSKTPSGTRYLSVLPFLAGGDTRLSVPKLAVAKNYPITVIGEAMKPMLEHGDLSLSVVGDFAVEDMIAQAAVTLGALPSRAAYNDAPERRVLNYPTPPQTQVLRYRPAAKNAAAQLEFYWPVRTALTRELKVRGRLLALVLLDRVRVVIRDGQGETYAPSADFSWAEAFVGYSYVHAELQVKPERAKKLAAVVTDVVSALAKSGIQDDEFARAKAQLAATAKRRLQENGFWLESVLADPQMKPAQLDEARRTEEDVFAIRKAEVDALARDVLSAKNLFQFTIQPSG